MAPAVFCLVSLGVLALLSVPSAFCGYYKCCDNCYHFNGFYINNCSVCREPIYAVAGDNVKLACHSCHPPEVRVNATWLRPHIHTNTSAMVDGVSRSLTLPNVQASQSGLYICAGDMKEERAMQTLVVCEIPKVSNISCIVSYDHNYNYKDGFFVSCSWPLKSGKSQETCAYRINATVKHRSANTSRLICTLNCSADSCWCLNKRGAYWNELKSDHFVFKAEVTITVGNNSTLPLRELLRINEGPTVVEKPIEDFYTPAADFDVKLISSNSVIVELPLRSYPYSGINSERQCQVIVTRWNDQQKVSVSNSCFETGSRLERCIQVFGLEPYTTYRIQLRYKHFGVGRYSEWREFNVSTKGVAPLYPPDFHVVYRLTGGTQPAAQIFSTRIPKSFIQGPSLQYKLYSAEAAELYSSATPQLLVKLSDDRLKWKREQEQEQEQFSTILDFALWNEFGESKIPLSISQPSNSAPKSACLQVAPAATTSVTWEKPNDKGEISHYFVCECRADSWSSCNSWVSCWNVSGLESSFKPAAHVGSQVVYGVGVCYSRPGNDCSSMQDAVQLCSELGDHDRRLFTALMWGLILVVSLSSLVLLLCLVKSNSWRKVKSLCEANHYENPSVAISSAYAVSPLETSIIEYKDWSFRDDEHEHQCNDIQQSLWQHS